MKRKLILSFCTSFFIAGTNLIYSQITITEVEKTEERIVLKPAPYDSLKNWEYHEKLGDNKQYIGLQIYLPPTPNKSIGVYPGSQNNFLFSIKPSIIKTNVKSSFTDYNSTKWEEHVYDSLVTFVYNPFHYYYGGNMVGVCSDSATISNTYFTIINVIYGKKLDSILRFMENAFHDFKKQKRGNIFIPNIRNEISYNYNDRPSYIFLLKNNKNNDSLYCFYNSNFILVPYFVKQKDLYQNINLIYDDEKTDYGTFKNSFREEFDTRFNVKYEDDNGHEKSTGKKVVLAPGSKWICKEVTLLKPSFKIYYILKNDKDEQIALTDFKGFIDEKVYTKRESDKKLQYQLLVAKQKQEELLRKENERKEIEKRKSECIGLFGQQNGELIAQGKVKINMTKEMCKYGWGTPLWTSKTTTEYGTYEDWYYWLGYSLHFVNGSLKRIEE